MKRSSKKRVSSEKGRLGLGFAVGEKAEDARFGECSAGRARPSFLCWEITVGDHANCCAQGGTAGLGELELQHSRFCLGAQVRNGEQEVGAVGQRIQEQQQASKTAAK